MTAEEQYKQEMLDRYQEAHRLLMVYPHYRAWLDAEMAIYESAFGEGQAFMHGFMECFFMLTQYKNLQDDQVREALALMLNKSGADLKKGLSKLKALYMSGTFQK